MQESRIEFLFLQYSNDVHKFLVYFTRSHDVDDLVQDTFVKALRGMENFKGGNNKSWLLSIARNVAIDHDRKTKRALFVSNEPMPNLPSSEKSPDELVELKDTMERLLRLLDKMKPAYREVVICRAVMDMTSEDTARVLGWSTNRVDVTLHRAIKALRKYWGR